MSEVVWVALISAGSALVAALMTQLLAMKAAARLAAHTARTEALQWQRSEATRMREQGRADLREFWRLALQAQARIVDFLPRRADPVTNPLAQSATGAAAEAYAVALLGLAGVRPAAKEFYLATATVEFALESKAPEISDLIRTWRATFEKLEAAVLQAADGVQAQECETSASRSRL